MSSPTDAPIRVLVVDDDVDHAAIVRRTLERHGAFAVTHVADGFACLEALGREAYAVVLLDYSLPRMNGLEVLERIRALAVAVPVVMATGQGDERVAVQAMHAGAIDYVMKTSGYFATLPTVLNKVLKQHELAADNARLYAESTEQRARLAQIFASTSDGIVLVDGAGAILSVNRRAGEMLGFDADAVGGADLVEILAPACGGREAPGIVGLRALLGAPSTGGAGDLALAEAERIVRWIAQPTEHGPLRGFTLTFQDVTREREISRLKSDFVSFAAHQLRAPLTGIKWKLELAADEPDLSPVLRSCIEDAAGSADRLLAMIHDLLDVSRLESETLTSVRRETELGALTRAVLEDLAAQIAEKAHRVTVTAVDAAPVITDDQLLRQAIQNLVSNAVKYTPTGGTIDIAIAHADGGVEWSISDNGIGIPKSAQRRLFEKFYRADNATSVDTEGTGLGLYMVRLIIARFGGRLRWASEEGRGTTFAFTVPGQVGR